MQRIIEPALAKANMSKTELGRKMGVANYMSENPEREIYSG